MKKISIQTNILSIFLIFVGLIAFSLLSSQYYFSKKLAIESTQKKFQGIQKTITEHLFKEGKQTKIILNAKRKHSDLLEPITFNPIHPALAGLIQVLQIKKNIYALYFAHKNGDFYEVINMRNKSSLFHKYNAPEETLWTVITIINNQQQLAFLDKKLKVLGTKRVAKKYDPRARPWYIKALQSDQIIVTNPYLFSNLNQAGITYATEIGTKGVVLALDYTMDQLNKILAKNKTDIKSEVFIVNKNGNKLASSILREGILVNSNHFLSKCSFSL